jgi:hypothetical protein
VALSYTYGTDLSFKFDNPATLSRLQTPGSLSIRYILFAVSPIIKHTRYLTRILIQRFLWADALCILHFNKASTAKELNLTGAIYAKAIPTIIFTSADSNEGIRGPRGVSGSRKLQQHIVLFGTEQIVARRIRDH